MSHLKNWPEEDIKFLKDNRFLSTHDITIALNRTVNSIELKRTRMGLQRLARCIECGIVFTTINQHNKCAKCIPDEKTYQENYGKTPLGKYSTYKQNAKRRGLIFDLSLDEFLIYWQMSCSYCGRGIETIGIDRVNNSLGYIKDNLKSCCEICNRMKLQMGFEEWIAQMKRILENLDEK